MALAGPLRRRLRGDARCGPRGQGQVRIRRAEALAHRTERRRVDPRQGRLGGKDRSGGGGRAGSARWRRRTVQRHGGAAHTRGRRPRRRGRGRGAVVAGRPLLGRIRPRARSRPGRTPRAGRSVESGGPHPERGRREPGADAHRLRESRGRGLLLWGRGGLCPGDGIGRLRRGRCLRDQPGVRAAARRGLPGRLREGALQGRLRHGDRRDCGDGRPGAPQRSGARVVGRQRRHAARQR